jgi:ATP-dependent HslUV protease ATP-binding subunit HslU
MSYGFDYDPVRNRMCVRIAGLWTVDTVRQFAAASGAFSQETRAIRADYDVLIDSRDFPVQPGEVANLLPSIAEAGLTLTSGRAASVAQPASGRTHPDASPVANFHDDGGGGSMARRAGRPPHPNREPDPDMNDNLTPKTIVAALDSHIIGQADAKKAVAVALRNRWRRQRLSADLRDEVTPKNILMIGPTGCGKTEISRRLAKLADAPFVKVEATKFTEVGYVGRDVEQIARDLVEEAIRLEKDRRRDAVKDKAEEAAMGRLLDALTGKDSSTATREAFKQRFHDGVLDQTEIEIEVEQASQMPFDIPGGAPQMINLGEMMKGLTGSPLKKRKLNVRAAWEKLIEEEADKRLDQDEVSRVALANAEANGIVFLDEIDKIAVSDVRGGSVSREGVQRDLLPLIEGTTVATKYGPMKTDHILFIASGAFHVAKPSDLLPELQGRLPIRVELKALTEEDFVAILSDTKASLTQQYVALIGTEGVEIEFAEDGIRAIARIAAEVNAEIENIGARRLQTVMEKLLEEISFNAEDRSGSKLVVDAAYVESQLASIARNTDLSRYVL